MHILQSHRSYIVSGARAEDQFKNLQMWFIAKCTVPQRGRHQSCQMSGGGRCRPSSSTAPSSRSSWSTHLSPWPMDGGPRDQGKGGEDPWEEFEVVKIVWWANLDTAATAVSRRTKIKIRDKMTLHSMLWQFKNPNRILLNVARYQSFDIFLLFPGKLTGQHCGQQIWGRDFWRTFSQQACKGFWKFEHESSNKCTFPLSSATAALII